MFWFAVILERALFLTFLRKRRSCCVGHVTSEATPLILQNFLIEINIFWDIFIRLVFKSYFCVFCWLFVSDTRYCLMKMKFFLQFANRRCIKLFASDIFAFFFIHHMLVRSRLYINDFGVLRWSFLGVIHLRLHMVKICSLPDVRSWAEKLHFGFTSVVESRFFVITFTFLQFSCLYWREKRNCLKQFLHRLNVKTQPFLLN